MAKEENKSTENKSTENLNEQNGENLVKGQVNEKLYSENPLNEGYQPTDELDTSNPPVDINTDETE